MKIVGFEIDYPTHFFSDNKSMVLNILMPESTFKKIHHSITYHAVRWSAPANS